MDKVGKMVSTPNTSCSSDDCLYATGKLRQGKELDRTLPSPQRSDTEGSDTDTSQDHHDGVVYQAYQAIWNHFCGLPCQVQEENPTFLLENQCSYEELYKRLAKREGLLEHFEDHLRKDWNAVTGVLELRLMATTIHEYVEIYLGDCIEEALNHIAVEHPSLRTLRRQLLRLGHTRIRVKTGESIAPVSEKSPDGQILFKGTAKPCFVFEVAYSQKKDDLLLKIQQYFEDSCLETLALLVVDIQYSPPAKRLDRSHSHSASISLWASTKPHDVVEVQCLTDAEPFRDNNGLALPGELVFPFSLFLPPQERSSNPLASNVNLHLDFKSLAKMLETAEEAELDIEMAPLDPRRPAVRWRDKTGVITRERKAEVKQPKITSPTEQPVLPGRTRSSSRPRSVGRLRRSSRIRASSKKESPATL